MQQLSVTAVGQDHPGIVAEVTKVLYEQGCNLDDCSMSLLSGQFAMIMLLEAPDGLSPADLERALSAPADRAGITVFAARVEPGPDVFPAHPYVVSVYGADHPGIVYRVCAGLAADGVNITNLVSRASNAIYTVVLDIDVPEEVLPDQLAEKLQRIAREEGVELRLRPADIETL